MKFKKQDDVKMYKYGAAIQQPMDIEVDVKPYNIKEQENDPVAHPSHYTRGKIEVIDYIEDKNFDFCLGNAIKYISRAGYKQNAVEDLRKAIWYIEREIAKLSGDGTCD